MSVTPTPDPTLGRIPRVLVPVELDAMVLRTDTGGFRRLPDADAAGHGPAAAAAATVLRPCRHPARRACYLHWALPDALTSQRPAGAAGAASNAALDARHPRPLAGHAPRPRPHPGPPRGRRLGDRGQRTPAPHGRHRWPAWTESGTLPDTRPRADRAGPRGPGVGGVLRQCGQPAGLLRPAGRTAPAARSPTWCAAGMPTPARPAGRRPRSPR